MFPLWIRDLQHDKKAKKKNCKISIRRRTIHSIKHILILWGLKRILFVNFWFWPSASSYFHRRICLVPRRLSFDENWRAKEGGKGTTGEAALNLSSVPFPCPLRFIASHSRFALASTMRKTKRLRRKLSQNPYQFSSMERATQAWAETSIGGVALSRSGMSLIISALQCKYSTKMQTYKNKNEMTVWS